MSLQHEDDLPPLTPTQQAEAIRLAARLQAEHEASASSEELIRAAQEAGIEPRFLREAITTVTKRNAWEPASGVAWTPSEWTFVLAPLAGLLFPAYVAPSFVPLIVGSVLLSFFAALVPTTQGRPKAHAYLVAFAGGMLADAVLFLAHYDVHGEFTNFGWSQLATVVLGAALARLVSLNAMQDKATERGTRRVARAPRDGARFWTNADFSLLGARTAHLDLAFLPFLLPRLLAFGTVSPITAPLIWGVGLLFGFTTTRRTQHVGLAPLVSLLSWVVIAPIFALLSQLASGNTGLLDGRFLLAVVPVEITMVCLGGALAWPFLPRDGSHRPQSA